MMSLLPTKSLNLILSTPSYTGAINFAILATEQNLIGRCNILPLRAICKSHIRRATGIILTVDPSHKKEASRYFNNILKPFFNLKWF